MLYVADYPDERFELSDITLSGSLQPIALFA
jgi:hypothetical protein